MLTKGQYLYTKDAVAKYISNKGLLPNAIENGDDALKNIKFAEAMDQFKIALDIKEDLLVRNKFESSKNINSIIFMTVADLPNPVLAAKTPP